MQIQLFLKGLEQEFAFGNKSYVKVDENICFGNCSNGPLEAAKGDQFSLKGYTLC
jgi:hypothetical protein